MGNLLTHWRPWSVGTLLPNPSSLSSASVTSTYLLPRAFSIIAFVTRALELALEDKDGASVRGACHCCLREMGAWVGDE
jgi:hypothetical protein